MLTNYIEMSLKSARYDMIDNDEPFYGYIPKLKGVWSTGKTLEKCRENLKAILEEWLLICITNKFPIPSISGAKIEEIKCLN